MILDATAGKRMMWFNKERSDTIYMDLKRDVHPDIVADFRHLPFRDGTFQLIVFDPPHTSAGPKGIFYQKFGTMRADRLAPDLYRATNELFRVLKNSGILIFKWNTHSYSLRRVLGLFPAAPLFAQKTAFRTKHSSSTFWATFIKEV